MGKRQRKHAGYKLLSLVFLIACALLPKSTAAGYQPVDRNGGYPVWVGNVAVGATTFSLIGRVLFLGTGLLGIPTTIKVIAFTTTGTYEVRLFDSTNSAVLATSSVLSNTTQQIITLPVSPTLFPVGEAMVDVQARAVTGTSPTVRVQYMGMY